MLENKARSMPVEQVREKMMGIFGGIPPETHGSKWGDLWNDNFLPWDRGAPSPALIDLLATVSDSQAESSSPRATAALRTQSTQPRKRAFVPGCGRGYDVALLAGLGYDAYGLDISQKAMQLAREFHQENPVDAAPGREKGKMEFVVGDFFKNEWIRSAGIVGENENTEGAFDLAYDYTFLCALEPSMRPSWAKQMTHFLAKGTGILICLEFPLYKELSAGGPPWALRSEYYDELLKDGFELLERFAPERTHPIGQGTDRMSVWRRRP